MGFGRRVGDGEYEMDEGEMKEDKMEDLYR